MGEKFLTLIFSVIAIAIGSNLYGISVAYMAAYLITVAIGFVILETKVYSIIRNKIVPKYRYNELLLFSLPLFLTGIFTLALSWGDTFLLGIFMNEKIVGIYNVAFPLSYSLLMIPKSLDAVYYPISATLFAQKKIKQLSDTFNTMARWVFALMWPLFLIMIFFSQQIIFTLFGQEYVTGWKVLIIVSVGIFIYSIVGPVETMLQTFNKTRFIFIMYSSIVIINVLMNLYLIPILGMEGAAISTSFLWSAVGIIEMIRVRKLLPIRYELKYYAKYVISGMIALLAVFALGKMISNISGIVLLIICGLLFGILYLGLLILMGAFAKEDLMIMSAIERRLGLDLTFIKRIIRRFQG